MLSPSSPSCIGMTTNQNASEESPLILEDEVFRLMVISPAFGPGNKLPNSDLVGSPVLK